MYVNIIGAVVIGRNEGQRLINCLDSLRDKITHIVYVDSGSTDNSLNEAKARNVHTIELDLSIPFTAARARNEGGRYLIQNYPGLEYFQFIDGDCELQLGWIEHSYNFLNEHSEVAVACGRRRERYPEHSIYNKMCDIEWNTPIGETSTCGGDALIRVDAFKQVKGYRDDMIAGEEPEMCFRLREQGWKIYRIDAEMVLHDAAMTKFSQWWKRSVRTGYAFALGSSIHGESKERYWVKERLRIIFWGITLPFFIIILSIFNSSFLFLFLIYVFQVFRVGLQRNDLPIIKYVWSIGVVLGKLPEAFGLVKFYFTKFGLQNLKIIEYK